MVDRPWISFALQRTRALPGPVRYTATVGLVMLVFAARYGFDQGSQGTYPFDHFLPVVLICAALFDSGAGLLATGLSAVLVSWFYLPPAGSLALGSHREWIALGLFILVGVMMTIVVEALHRTIARLQQAHDDLVLSEHARGVLLREFRHRTRNDLGSLVALLMLRARIAPSAAAREALREAADHALALARVHARLEPDEKLTHSITAVDTRDFVTGLCADIEAAQFGDGLRPIRLVAEVESHLLPADRAVPLGLVLNETVTNALKYAFPENRAGIVHVRFTRETENYVLTVSDDGIGLPPEGEIEPAPTSTALRGTGLGTRLLCALAAQLRGGFARHPGEAGRGTVAELRFAAAEGGR